MKKFVAITLAIVVALGCLAGCGGSKEDTVLTAEGIKVSWDEYMYYLGEAAYNLENYYQSATGAGVDWDGICVYDKSLTNTEWCLREAQYMASQSGTILSKGKSMNCSVTDEQLKDIDSNIEQIKENYETEDELQQALTEQGLTMEVYKQINVINYTLGNIFTEIYGEKGEKLSADALNKYIEDNGYMSSAHILFKTTEDVENEDGAATTQELSDAAKAEKKAQAEKLCKELQAITDENARKDKFFEYVEQYSEDPGKANFPNGYCFTDGAMVEVYTETSKALKAYEVSDVVESDYGYHIIMGMPTTADSVDVSNQYGYTLGQMAASTDFDTEMKSWGSIDRVKFVAAYKTFDFSQFFDKDGFHYVSFAEYKAK